MNKIVEKAKKPLLCVFLILYVAYIILAVVYFSSNYWLEIISSDLFKEMQAANDMLLYTGIIGICAFAVFAIVGSISRKNYYLSNLIFNTAAAVVSIVVSFVVIIQQVEMLPKYNEVLPALISWTEDMEGGTVTPSANVMYIAIVLSILAIVAAVLFIGVTVVKFIDTKKKYSEKHNVKEVLN